MELGTIDEKILQLVAKLSDSKDDAETVRLGEELRALMRDHEKYVRRMAAAVAKQVRDNPPHS